MLNHADINGGAARAAYRIHHALRQQGIDSVMHVNQAIAGDWTVQRPPGKWERALTKARAPFGEVATRLLKTGNSVIHSPAILPSAWPKRLNNSDADVVHLHWVNSEMLSISNIGQFRKPLVWTLHDMWAFCGAEHYTEDFRWRDGYIKANRPSHESGFDLNRWVWQRKRKHWQRPMHIVTPSKWLADCVRESKLMHDWPVDVIPNTIDTDNWQPIDKTLARQILQLPTDVPLLLFAAIGGIQDERKGFDLLYNAMRLLDGQIPELEMIILGQYAPRKPKDYGLPVHYTGHIYDDVSLRLVYSAADALVIPSRQDNLPNTGIEALSCRTPVVAFDTCGLPDIVQHKKTGYLAKAFDIADLANGIRWVLQVQSESRVFGNISRISGNARQDAILRFSNHVVAEEYLRVYRRVVNF